DAQRLRRAFVLAREDHLERRTGTDEPWQAIRSTRTGNQAELHLGQAELGLGMIRCNPVVGGQCQFESAAETRAVNRGDNRLGAVGDLLHQQLTVARQSRRVVGRAEPDEFLDVGTCDERVGLARTQHHRLHDLVAQQPLEQFLELPTHVGGDLVDRLVGQVERDDGDATADLGGERAHGTRSSTIANPIPPWAQIEINPNSTSRRTISLASVVTIRAPVAANGCPSAIDPPETLVRSQSTSPTGAPNPSRSAHAVEPHAWTFDNTCDANASWISTNPRCCQVIPARRSASGTAYTGPISSCQPGSTAATA